MRDGVSVYGNYDPGTWQRCAGVYPVVVLQPAAATGLLFPSTVTAPTVLV
jgi:hypothetical protein